MGRWRETTPLSREDYKMMRLPRRYVDVEVDKIPSEKLRTKVVEYMSNLRAHFEKGEGMNVLGGNGVGKTCAMSIIIQYYQMKGRGTMFTYASDVVEAKMSDEKVFGYKDLYQHMLDTEVVLIDDLNKENLSNRTGFFKNTLTNFIKKRYADMKVNIITSNLGMNSIKDKYGENLFSVLKHNISVNVTDSRDQRGKND